MYSCHQPKGRSRPHLHTSLHQNLPQGCWGPYSPHLVCRACDTIQSSFLYCLCPSVELSLAWRPVQAAPAACRSYQFRTCVFSLCMPSSLWLSWVFCNARPQKITPVKPMQTMHSTCLTSAREGKNCKDKSIGKSSSAHNEIDSSFLANLSG